MSAKKESKDKDEKEAKAAAKAEEAQAEHREEIQAAWRSPTRAELHVSVACEDGEFPLDAADGYVTLGGTKFDREQWANFLKEAQKAFQVVA